MPGIGNRQLFQLVIDLGPLAHTGGVNQADLAIGRDAVELFLLGQRVVVPDPVHRDTVPRDTRFRTGDQPVFTQHLVDQCRLARIGTTDNGQFQRC